MLAFLLFAGPKCTAQCGFAYVQASACVQAVGQQHVCLPMQQVQAAGLFGTYAWLGACDASTAAVY